MCNNFFPKIVFLWGDVEKYGTAGQATEDNITRHMRIACWINNATDSHSEYVKLAAFPRRTATVVTRTHVNVTFTLGGTYSNQRASNGQIPHNKYVRYDRGSQSLCTTD